MKPDDIRTGGHQARPSLAVLADEQVARIHAKSLHLLATVGVRVDSARARQLLTRAAGRAASRSIGDGNRVCIPPELIEWAIQVAPCSVDIYDRSGAHAFRLPGPTRFGIGVTALYYQDAETDEVTPFSRRDMAALVRLGGALSSYDAVSTPGIIQDVPTWAADLVSVLEMVANTTKPLVILVSDESVFPAALDLVEALHGDLGARPFVLPYVNPITPLVINQGSVDKVWASIERGLPVIYSNYGMSGASTPITPGGSLVLLNAELLAGLVLAQLIREGAPVILGSLPACFDMRGMGSYYSAQSYVVDIACAEMMAYYGLPHCGTSGSGVGWGPDIIAAGHQWLNHLVSCIGKVGLVPFVGDNLGSMAISPAVIVYADEVIAQARLFAEGFALDDRSIGLDEIAKVGPGGSFLTTGLTLERFRDATYRSKVLPNLTLERWQARGSPQAGTELRNHTRRLLAEAAHPADHDDLLARGQALIPGL